MIEDFLRADADRWNAQQPPPPDLDAAIDQLADGPAPRGRRTLLGVLSASSVVAAAAAVVVISASVTDHPAHHSTSAGSVPVRVVTSTVVATVTRTVDVLDEPPRPQTAGATLTATARIRAATALTSVPSIPRTFVATVEIQPAVVSQSAPRPAFGHVRALLASLGMFVVIAGAWGIGRAQRRRAH